MNRARFFVLSLAILTLPAFCEDADPCAKPAARALVLSGGGAKGAFEAGAVYHLVVHRGCDFRDFSGVSAGALNAAFLAQAPVEGDSLSNLKIHAGKLVEVWRGIRSRKDILRGRFLATPRLVVFGIESLNDFKPLRALIERNIRMEALAHSGRAVRVGTVSFYDGTYREVALGADPLEQFQFLDYIYASALIPVYGAMPRIQENFVQTPDSENWSQFADGSIRHTTPVVGYFPIRRTRAFTAAAREGAGQEGPLETPADIPPHGSLEQLFIVVASPYNPASDSLPTPANGSRHVTDGREILKRTLIVVLDAPYRWDLDYALMANSALESRRDLLRWAKTSLGPEQRGEFLAHFNQFPITSFNRDADGASEPYVLALVSPEKEFAETYEFDPANTRMQLHKGCLAANEMMVGRFHGADMRKQCDDEFPELPAVP